tara:strand:+ start:355 stop:1020 length:666 start_codon:yes stop_codon:yes gene_type:complete
MHFFDKNDFIKTDHYIDTLKKIFFNMEKEMQLQFGHSDKVFGWNLHEYMEYKKFILLETEHSSFRESYNMFFFFPFYFFTDDEKVSYKNNFEEIKKFHNLQIKFRITKYFCKENLLGKKYAYEFFINASHGSGPIEKMDGDCDTVRDNENYYKLYTPDTDKRLGFETYEDLTEGYIVSKNISDVFTRSFDIWKLIMRYKTIKDLRLLDKAQSTQTIHSLYK